MKAERILGSPDRQRTDMVSLPFQTYVDFTFWENTAKISMVNAIYVPNKFFDARIMDGSLKEYSALYLLYL